MTNRPQISQQTTLHSAFMSYPHCAQDATNISLLDGSTDVAAATRGLGPAPAQQNGGPGAAAATGHGIGYSLCTSSAGPRHNLLVSRSRLACSRMDTHAAVSSFQSLRQQTGDCGAEACTARDLI
jgi:hypothetical protein